MRLLCAASLISPWYADGTPSVAVASDSTMQAESHTVQAAAQQPQPPRLPSAPFLEQDASGIPSGQQVAEPALQETSLPLQASDSQTAQLDLRVQTAASQLSQQPHHETQQSQEAPSMQQQHSGTSDVVQSTTQAAAVSAVGLKQQTTESSGSAHESDGPVAVFTSAVTGAGLKDLLLQVEHKVRGNALTSSSTRSVEHSQGGMAVQLDGRCVFEVFFVRKGAVS